jgi:citrate synthase
VDEVVDIDESVEIDSARVDPILHIGGTMTSTHSTPATQPTGLEGIVVADTELSDVDGERGRLVLRGHDVESLVGRVTFEDVVGLLWDGALPDDRRRAEIVRALAAGRVKAFELLPRLGDALARDDGMDALRASMAHVPFDDPFDVVAAVATFAAAFSRRKNGLSAIAPDPNGASHAADTLRMILGRDVDPELAAGLDAYFVTVADHGLNASTFTARVVASTGSDLVSAIVAAIGALKGPLHGGAPGPVLDMLDAIRDPSRAHAWLERELAAKRRIMGMGHRIYRVRDPRAAVLERAVVAMERASATHTAARLPLAHAVERAAQDLLRAKHPERTLQTNVEFYTAILLDALGIPRALFSPMFAASRVAGWCAHVAEQRASGRLIRPASRYVGPAPA